MYNISVGWGVAKQRQSHLSRHLYLHRSVGRPVTHCQNIHIQFNATGHLVPGHLGEGEKAQDNGVLSIWGKLGIFIINYYYCTHAVLTCSIG